MPGLWQQDTTACCARHKVEPLFGALERYDVWFTGLRREQSPSRAALQEVEPFTLPTGKVLRKVSPLATWTTQRGLGLREDATTFRCCRSTTSATPASAASRARRCRSIPPTSDRAAGRAEARMRDSYPGREVTTPVVAPAWRRALSIYASSLPDPGGAAPASPDFRRGAGPGVSFNRGRTRSRVRIIS